MLSDELILQAERRADALADECEAISHFIFTHPELGLEEHQSSRYLVEYLQQRGFSAIHPYAGLATAFRAEYGTTGPRIAFLAEYDALPGYGEDGTDNGHACGHNWIAASAVGAAVVLSAFADALGFRVAVIGTPAEESYGAKVDMVEQGVFDDVDLVLQTHLAAEHCVCYKALAMDTFVFHYTGKAAHASAAPWNGINALDAVHLLYAGISAFRQQLKPDMRIHGIITDGGTVANTLPDQASAEYMTRASTRADLDRLNARVTDIARGAALMTGATLDITRSELPLDHLIHIPSLQALTVKHWARYGIVPQVDEVRAEAIAGSTDIGNVSHVCPTMYMEVGLDAPEPLQVHEASALALVDGPFAYARLHHIVKAMATMVLEYVTDGRLRRTIAEEFAARRPSRR